jgi:hypothetical protein
MSEAGPVAERPAAAAVLASAVVVSGFEVAVLLRCARTGSGRYGRAAAGASAVELSRAAAADRLVLLLSALGLPAHRDQFAAGGWHRYTVHRVHCPDLDSALLERVWCAGYQKLCDPNAYQSVRQRRQRGELAAAAWRAAVLVGGLRSRGGPLAVRVTEPDLALVLVRAARVLGAPVDLRTVGGRHLVEVKGSGAEVTLREVAGATLAG